MFLVLTIASLLIPNIYFGSSLESTWSRNAADLVGSVSREAVDVLERSGEADLVRYLGQIERDYSVRPVLFQRGDVELGPSSGVEPLWRATAQMAAKLDGPYVRGTLAAQRVLGASGKMYVLVLAYRPFRSRVWPAAETILTILVAASLFCFLITRHVTAPIFGWSEEFMGEFGLRQFAK
jgi:hypothetical protein